VIQSPLAFLVWVSFLPSIAYQLLHSNKNLFFCLHCKKQNNFLQHVAIFSYLFSPSNKCCKTTKPFLNLVFDLFAFSTFIILWQTNNQYFATYFIFISAMLLVIQTDVREMLISKFTTIYLIPLAWVLSYFNQTSISLSSSIAGTLFGFSILWTTKTLFKKSTGQDGLGEGDIDLLSMIGAFTGILGAWVSLSIGSIVGTIVISLYKLAKPQYSNAQFPFGFFLALGGIIFSLFPTQFVKYFLS